MKDRLKIDEYKLGLALSFGIYICLPIAGCLTLAHMVGNKQEIERTQSGYELSAEVRGYSYGIGSGYRQLEAVVENEGDLVQIEYVGDNKTKAAAIMETAQNNPTNNTVNLRGFYKGDKLLVNRIRYKNITTQ